MSDDTLTNAEMDALRALGWRIGGGGFYDGVVLVGGVKDGKRELRTRAEWRALLASTTHRVVAVYDLGIGGIGILEGQLEATQRELAECRKTLAAEGLPWDYTAGAAIERVSLPTGPDAPTAPIEETQACALLDSLYANGDLSIDQYDGIMRGFQAAAATRAALARRVSEREALRAILASALAGRWDAAEARRVLEETT